MPIYGHIRVPKDASHLGAAEDKNQSLRLRQQPPTPYPRPVAFQLAKGNEDPIEELKPSGETYIISNNFPYDSIS